MLMSLCPRVIFVAAAAASASELLRRSEHATEGTHKMRGRFCSLFIAPHEALTGPDPASHRADACRTAYHIRSRRRSHVRTTNSLIIGPGVLLVSGKDRPRDLRHGN